MKNRGLILSLWITVIVFVLMTIIGLVSDISVTTVLMRALGATIVVGILVYGLLYYVFFSMEHVLNREDDDQKNKMGSQIDFLAGQDEDLNSILNMSLQDDINNSPDNQENPADQQFRPFTPQQINPHLQTIIKEDPKQIAEIITKMGLEE